MHGQTIQLFHAHSLRRSHEVVKEGRRGYFAGQREDRAVRNHMVTFADIGKMTDRELQVLLEVVDRKDLVVSLKAAAEELKDKILGNMSEEARAFISAEMKELGPMRLSEVEEVQLRIVQQVRQLEEQGKLTIIRGDAGQMC